ncbi:MAG: diguanylate cyclase, partial [Epsilonproteobacteria bacterium]|nr:diguanylate cyclase [Campylobacterota bacterium]
MKTYNLAIKDIDTQKIKDFLSTVPKKENLIQIFSGIIDKDKIKQIVNTIKQSYPNANIIGSTTDGEIIDGKVTSKNIVISVSVFDKAKVKTLLMQKNTKSLQFGEEFAKRIITPNSKVLIAFTDGLHMNGEDFLKGIEKVSDIIVAGGMAGDNGKFRSTYIFDKDNILDNGAVGAVIEGDIKVYNDFGFNWEGVGKKLKVTKAIKNIVYEIDGKKPVDIYKHYLGIEDVVRVGVQFPLIVHKNGLKIARAVIGQNEDGSLIFAGNVDEGDEVQIGFGDISRILQKDKALFES